MSLKMKKLLGLSSVATLSLIIASCAPEAETAPETETTAEAAEPGVVETTYGTLQGVVSEDGAYVSFQGVPFAAPPVGDFPALVRGRVGAHRQPLVPGPQ